MMQQAYATALWYLSYIMPVSHTDKNSSEAVPGNESSATTASFGKSKHARSLETAKDCSATVSNNRANGPVIVELSASNSIIAECSNDSASDSVIAERSASDSEEQACSQFGDCKRLFGNSQQKKCERFGDCCVQRERFGNCKAQQRRRMRFCNRAAQR